MFDFNSHMVLLILAAAVVTFLTRIGGYILIVKMTRIPPHVEAALNAVPAAVLTTLVAPAFFIGGWDTKVAMLAALLVGLRYPSTYMLVAGWVVVMAWRHSIGA
ncbi:MULTISPECIES: AzlD family protein [Rhizobium]|uniref:AzlD family protein n=1 Tax=Rhizobium tropici TaxID=398 RepID=A0A329YFC9_RHITR|nr:MULTISPECIES: AzlD family protein [Rhizobium]MBB3285894.1 putative membrane protein [Rhizobium sp. BK252]MBB3400944.1 putative membrane protein [Rhizobium sp. BK289]MBB3413212.1 putative membrane protein [Rhizobium sp. BK284]MBB3481410.1 putative membrane protein [Rhizobium sp. BK347]RAX39160.1 AzlD family protein [Rhizobium tropici]